MGGPVSDDPHDLDVVEDPKVAEHVRRCFGAGLIGPSDKVTGCWFAFGSDDAASEDETSLPISVHVMSRTLDGRLLAGVVERWDPVEEDWQVQEVVEAVERSSPTMDSFCACLYVVAWTLGFGGAPLFHREGVVQGMLLSVERRFGPVDRKAARVAVERALASIGACLAQYLDSVDVNATMAMDSCQWEPGAVDARALWSPLVDALRHRPALAPTILNAWTRDATGFRQAHAAGGPDLAIVGHLAAEHGMPQALARRALLMSEDEDALEALSHGIMFHEVEACQVDAPVVVLASALTHLPVDWHPRDLASTVDFSTCVLAVQVARTWCADPAHLPRLLNAKGRWREFGERLRATAGVDDLNVVLIEAVNFADRFQEQVLAPAIMRCDGAAPWDGLPEEVEQELSMVVRSILTSGATLPAIVEASTRWRRDEARVSAVAAGLTGPHADEIRWDPAFPSVREGDLALTVLTTPRDLQAEGAAHADQDGVMGLGHCVGGYSAHCMDGWARIASITGRGPDGRVRRLSTAELRLTDGIVHAVQHKGERNGPPPPEAEALLGSYLDALMTERLHVDDKALARDGRSRSIMLSAGYDWTEPGNVEAVLAAWEPYLPRRLRGLDVEAWVNLANRDVPSGTGWWTPDPVIPG